MKTNNKRDLLIKGADGNYSPFLAINRIKKDSYVKVTTKNGLYIECSEDHPVFLDMGHVSLEAKYLDIGTHIMTLSGLSEVVSNETITEPTDLYDIVESSNRNSYYTNGILSHNCGFVGSSNTLVESSVIEGLVFANPINEMVGDLKEEDRVMWVYEEPKPNRRYVVVADPSEGIGQDSSVCTVFDSTKIPYRIVAKYKNRYADPITFPHTIIDIAKQYGNAPVLVEANNDVGGQVSYICYYELEYENVVLTARNPKTRDHTTTPRPRLAAPGIKTDKRVKAQGCSNLKSMVEGGAIEVCDYDFISELGTFVRKNNSYAADTDCHDDCVMTMVLFAWFVRQDFFKEYSSTNISSHLYERSLRQMMESVLPFGFKNDGSSEVPDVPIIDLSTGVILSKASSLESFMNS